MSFPMALKCWTLHTLRTLVSSTRQREKPRDSPRTGPCPSWATPYEAAAASHPDRVAGPWGRDGDHLYMLYTGGTTGMPKGVMWRHDDLRRAQLDSAGLLGPAPQDMDETVTMIRTDGPGRVFLPACPMMHGTGLLSALGTLMGGGCIVTLENPSFDADELWRVVERHRVQSVAIVGDAFAKPMLAALDNAPRSYDTSSLISILSSGVMWSREVKDGLIRHIPQVALMDAFGASEGLGYGLSVTTAQGSVQTAKFVIGEHCDVFDESDAMVEAGSGIPGFIARKGAIPVGYYKDPEKSAKTFRTIGGVRYSIPGDWCIVEADGSLTLLGRGSACINTAGEKVFPEEVEEALKTHPSVEDALVVGLPDEKWGQAVTGVVKLSPGETLDEDALRAHVRKHLAGYKTPKRIVATETNFRASNGKADYKTAKSVAEEALA